MRHPAFLAALAAAATAFGLGCGSPSYKYEGDECVATSECADGLVCDFGQTPAVCATTTTRPPDADPTVPDAAPAVDGEPGSPDARPPVDAAVPDAAVPDATVPDATVPDAMVPDAMP